jgi:mRNA interferase MazF
VAHYVPRKGDFITLSFDPQAGHEQSGRRPALVVSNDLFNQHTGLVIVCPITNTDRRFPFHLPVPPTSTLTGFVMVEQVKSVDHVRRKARFIEPVPAEFLETVLDLIITCMR